MSLFSHRFALPVAGLLLFALVPTVFNVYRRPPALEAGRLAADLPATLAPSGRARPGTREAAWVRHHFDAVDFVSRVYGSETAREIELFAVRSYDGKKLFHFPELAISYGYAATAARLETLADGPPLHVLEFGTSKSTRIAAYALLYGERGVARPVRFMLERLPELFVGHREPMTLLYAQGETTSELAPELEEELKALLAAACKEYCK